MRKLATTITVALVVAVGAAHAASNGCYGTCTTPQEKRKAVDAIKYVFRGYSSSALRVARCESGMSIRAHNGQYLGLFQMGSSERARFGHGNTAWQQTVAAYSYFIESGRDWSPWSCKPY